MLMVIFFRKIFDYLDLWTSYLLFYRSAEKKISLKIYDEMESDWYVRLVGTVAGNVMTLNMINKNDATKSELNFELVGV